ncbi:ATP-binding protein [Mesorhizobium sp. M0674]|uniref:ATP-binding protein n=1 Tax=unclassified Mesorhizobium TaxID=325217 RepID=UPI00333C5234
MMQLVHIALVQWHLFDREDLAIAGDTAILGQNRSGKSTLIDLIQAVMTGGGPALVPIQPLGGRNRQPQIGADLARLLLGSTQRA